MAIVGIGVDTCEVERIAKAVRRIHFYERVFGKREQQLFARRGGCVESQAANFAAKEAFGKALGSGIMKEFALCEVQALRTEQGAPYFFLEGRVHELMQQRGWRAHLSLTHETGLATAFVILEEI